MGNAGGLRNSFKQTAQAALGQLRKEGARGILKSIGQGLTNFKAGWKSARAELGALSRSDFLKKLSEPARNQLGAYMVGGPTGLPSNPNVYEKLPDASDKMHERLSERK